MRLINYLFVALLTLPSLSFAAHPPLPDIAAKSYFLVDLQSGVTLASLDSDSRIEPASLTKLMTAYLTFQAIKENHLKLDQMLNVSINSWKTGGSRMFLDPKVPVSVSDLIKGMIVQSGNDACVTLAEAIAGNEQVFSQMMNQEAQKLNLKNTHFENATGLPNPNHYSSTHDLALISAAIIRDFPGFYSIFSIKSFAYNKIKQANRNLLLFRDANIDGLKTGHTASAGYNLIASSHKNGRRVVSVVVGTASAQARAKESAKLLDWGLQFFDTKVFHKANESVAEIKIYKGKENKLNVGFLHDVFITTDKTDSNKPIAEITTTTPLIAPISKGQQVGTVTVKQSGKVIAHMPLVALQEVKPAGFFGRLWDSIKLLLGW